jgi:hypothetical protein
MEKYARYGCTHITFDMNPQETTFKDKGIVLDNSAYLFSSFNHNREKVLAKLQVSLKDYKLFIPDDQRFWTVSWKDLSVEKHKYPLINARDLVQAGYDPSQGDLFKRILVKLKFAILDGKAGDTKQSQMSWIKKNFII